jgi:hypothetical protein
VVRSAFLNIGAVTPTIAAEEPLALAFPVPPGADPTKLAVAVLVPPEDQLDNEADAASWLPLLGVHDPETGLFSVVLQALLPTGRNVVLIEHPDLRAAPALPAATRGSSRADPPEPIQFEGYCLGLPEGSWDCGPEDVTRLTTAMRASYDHFTSLGYANPALATKIVQVKYRPDGSKKPQSVDVRTYYGNLLKALDEECLLGARYWPDGKFIRLCYYRSIVDDAEIAYRVDHEMFHAFQFGSTELANNWNKVSTVDPATVEDWEWILEGTAAAAEESGSTMVRSGRRNLHPIHLALMASDNAGSPEKAIQYAAEDFWVWFGQRKGLPLGYLKPLFARGGTTQGAAAFFTEEHGTSLGEEYWGWVKNQAMEKTVPLRTADPPGEALKSPCHIETAVIGTPQELAFPAPGAGNEVATSLRSLPRLTAAAVKVTFPQGAPPVVTLSAEATGAGAGLKYKAYREGEDDCADPGKAPDGPRSFQGLTADDVIWVLVADTQHVYGQSFDYLVRVQAALD